MPSGRPDASVTASSSLSEVVAQRQPCVASVALVQEAAGLIRGKIVVLVGNVTDVQAQVEIAVDPVVRKQAVDGVGRDRLAVLTGSVEGRRGVGLTRVALA